MKYKLNILILLVLVVALLPAAATATPPQPWSLDETPEPATGQPVLAAVASEGAAPIPPQILAPVNLMLDDGSSENNVGIGGAWEFIWLNRFSPGASAYPFDLNEIQVYFGGGTTFVNPGDSIEMVVYENTSGNADPAVGANLLATFPETVQAVDAWNVYDISATPVTLNGPGDVLIGVIALTVPGSDYFPAAQDTTGSQQRSWAGWWLTSPPPDPPTLPPDDTWMLIDGFQPGNWMIRGYGQNAIVSQVMLEPVMITTEGCAGEVQTHTLTLNNQLGYADDLELDCTLTSGSAGLVVPPGPFPVADGASTDVDVNLTPYGVPGDVALVDCTLWDSTATYSDTSTIEKEVVAAGWTHREPMGIGRRDPAVIYGGEGGIYVIGGYYDDGSGGVPSTANERYDVATDTWSTMADIPDVYRIIDGDEIGGTIYIPGGHNGVVPPSLTTYAYDIAGDSWGTVANAPRAVTAYAAAACDGLLYRTGGGNTDATWPSGQTGVEVYDPGADAWTALSPMNEGRLWHAMECIDGKLYVAGGMGDAGQDLASAEVYDIATDTWSPLPDMPATWWASGDFQKHGNLYMAGGIVAGASSDATLTYIPAFNMWQYGPSLNSPHLRLEADFAVDSGYAIGGWNLGAALADNEYLFQCAGGPGLIEGHVYDGELGAPNPTCTDATVHLDPGDLEIYPDVDGYYRYVLSEGDYEVMAQAYGYSMDGPHTVAVTANMTTTWDMALMRPVVSVSPTELVSLTVVSGAPSVHQVTVSNDGHEPLDFEILELPAGVRAVATVEPAMQSTWLAGPVEIEPKLLSELEATGTTDFFVRMRRRADTSAAGQIEDWSERGWYVLKSLQAAAEDQAPVIAYAQARGLDYRTYLTENTVLIKGGTLDDVNTLAAREDIKSLRAVHVRQLEAPAPNTAAPEAFNWNLDILNPNAGLFGMQAAQVWDNYSIFGDDIVVASIDTGVFYEHVALVDHYRGNNGDGTFDHDYNWYNPTITGTLACGGVYTEPCDYHSHGSGVTGVMVGETADQVEQIGIAPSAQWIACMGCDSPPRGCSDEALLACGDWMVAPTDLEGLNPNPDLRPHVVNNSWGGEGCRDFYTDTIDVWVDAGIFPAFSAGNTVACGAVGSPGDNPDAFGTAAHDSVGENQYAGGPSCHFPNPSCDANAHEVDPHLNAPTFGRTAANAQDSYWIIDGTSGASPHTAGCVALVWAANPALIGDVEGTFTLLEQTADRSLAAAWAEGSCGKPACAGADPYPNYEYGWGYLDCLAAVEAVYQEELPWVNTEPTQGTVPALTDTEVSVTFLCDEPQEYEGTLRFVHNDPCQTPIDVQLQIDCTQGILNVYLPIILRDATP